MEKDTTTNRDCCETQPQPASETSVHVGVINEECKSPEAHTPLKCEWKALTYSVDVTPTEDDDSTRKVLLDRVYGEAIPGRLTVIMGPSGAGKTTLLNSLAGRTQNFEGEVRIIVCKTV